MMKLLGILAALIFTANSVHGLWSNKCKDAETSSDKVVRLIQNANCTLIEESRKFYVNLNNFRDGMRNKMEIFKELFRKSKEVTEDENLDHGIDVRMSTDDRNNTIEDLNLRRRRQSNEAENENEEPTGMLLRYMERLGIFQGTIWYDQELSSPYIISTSSVFKEINNKVFLLRNAKKRLFRPPPPFTKFS